MLLLGHGRLGHLTNRRHALWRSPAAAVTVGPTGGLSVTEWMSVDYLGDRAGEIRAEAGDTVGSVAV